jgi:hypothetical protein
MGINNLCRVRNERWYLGALHKELSSDRYIETTGNKVDRFDERLEWFAWRAHRIELESEAWEEVHIADVAAADAAAATDGPEGVHWEASNTAVREDHWEGDIEVVGSPGTEGEDHSKEDSRVAGEEGADCKEVGRVIGCEE